MGAGLAGRPPCLLHSQVLMGMGMGDWVRWETSLSTTQSGPYGDWVSWETALSTTHSQVLMGDWVTTVGDLPVYHTVRSLWDWVRWETALSTTVRSLWVLG